MTQLKASTPLETLHPAHTTVSAAITMMPGGAVEEPPRQLVYSTAQHDNFVTLGPTMLQGVGTVDGVASVAKVLLQRVQSSVCSAYRRQGGVPGQPLAHMQPPLLPQALPQVTDQAVPAHFATQVGQFVRPMA